MLLQAHSAMRGLLHQKAHLHYIANHLPTRLPSSGGRSMPQKVQPVSDDYAADENRSSNIDAVGQGPSSKPKKAAPRRYEASSVSHQLHSSAAQHLHYHAFERAPPQVMCQTLESSM